MRRAATSLFAAFLAALAAAPAQGADRDGIWQGTVGSLPVRACFTSRDWGGAFGAYYYLSHLKLIPLEQEEKTSAAFREQDSRDSKSPRWLIRKAAGDRLEGEWTGGGRKLPLRLTRLAAPAGEHGPCGSLAFHAPRLEGIKPVSSRASANGLPYTRIVLADRGRFGVRVETFALDGTAPPVRRINAALRKSLDGNPPEWFQCIQWSLAHGPYQGNFDESQAPAWVTSRWLSVEYAFDNYCGGNHPNSGTLYRTFDRRSGAEADLLDWFNATGVKRERFPGSEEDTKTVLPALRRAVIGSWKEEGEDCEGVVTEQAFWTVGLVRNGFVFTPSTARVAQACSTTFTVPFARLRPFLTREGLAEVRALQAETRRRAR